MSTQSEPSKAPSQRDIRRFAMQVLYQFDLRGDGDRDEMLDDIRTDTESADLGDAAFTLAIGAWNSHAACDALTTEIAPDWPSHRQPPLDRALLRLAYHEITTGRTPAKVAINEVVELAKTFCAERSPSFINGVLDKMVKRLDVPAALATDAPGTASTLVPPPTDQDWLDDALHGKDDEPANDTINGVNEDAADSATRDD